MMSLFLSYGYIIPQKTPKIKGYFKIPLQGAKEQKTVK